MKNNVYFLVFMILICGCSFKKEKAHKNNFKISNSKTKSESLISEIKLTREELGNASWKILHSFAASYPIEPTEQDKLSFNGLITAFTNLYPCKSCRKNFAKIIEENPIELNSRVEVIMYMCKIHNIVNVNLNKEEFDCSNVFERWGGEIEKNEKSCGCSQK